jgi:hypothetical protein
MHKTILLSLLCAALLAACAPTPTPPTPWTPPTRSATPLGPAGNQCYYVWAYQPLPDLSEEFLKAIQEIAPEAKARAEAYGENCVYPDGKSTFSAMETGFYVSLPVKDTTDEEALGSWIEQILDVIGQFDPARLPGMKVGRLNLVFASENENIPMMILLAKAEELRAQDVHGAELFQALLTNR